MKNRTLWTDCDGAPIQAHGGCILYHEGRWYWYGENKAAPTHNRRVDFLGFCCYSSTDLLHWHNHGVVLGPVDQPGHDLSPAGVGERPCVLYNAVTRQFVLWFHQDNADYSRAHLGLAVSDSPTGPFLYQGSLRPGGCDSRDFTAFVDEDGTGYLFCSSDWNTTMRILQLDQSYTGLTGAVTRVLVDQAREVPAVFRWKGACYMLSSGCTGWQPNSMLYAMAPAMMGSWRLMGEPCTGPSARSTFDGQSAAVFCAQGRPYLLLDHWQPDDLEHSAYSILPIRFERDRPVIAWQEEWNGLT